MAEWVMKKLKDIANFNPRESLAKGVVAKKVAMDKLQPFCRDIPGYELEPFSGGTKFRNGDTIMARITPCLENGKTAKVAVLDDGEVGFGSTEYIVFRAKDGIDEDFIYYLVCSPLVREPAIKSMVGSSGRQRVQTDVVQNLEIMVPDYEEQKRISGILKSLDDKIAANTEVNKNLLEQAQMIYQSWFIRYDPFGGKLPDDWKHGTLGEIAAIKTESWSPAKHPNTIVEHYSIPAFDEKRYPVFESSSEIKSNKYVLTPESVMISKLNPNTKRIWRPLCLSETPVCSTEFIVYEAKKESQRDFIFSIIDSVSFSNHLCAHVTGSTNSRQRAMPKTTLDFPVLIPTDDIITDFCNIVTPMYDLISSNIIENQSLAATRDSMLPKLMSGHLDISAFDF